MTEEYAIEWMKDFIKSINMKVLMGPYAKFLEVPGNTGLTVAAIIETSHIVMHTWTEVNPALIQFDVYSCGEFEAEDVCKKIAKDFELTKIEYKYLNRETGLMDISGGILNYKK
jgi:S-adenosylmethionine/arginine decarboxylase-like enzyme